VGGEGSACDVGAFGSLSVSEGGVAPAITFTVNDDVDGAAGRHGGDDGDSLRRASLLNARGAQPLHAWPACPPHPHPH
jgi:hypothetical protein